MVVAEECGDRGRQRSWSARWAVAAVVAVALLLLVMTMRLAGSRTAGPAGDATQTPSALAVVCAAARTDPTFCERWVTDLVTRESLTEAQRSSVQEQARPVLVAMDRLPSHTSSCPPRADTGGPPPCASVPMPVAVEDVRTVIDSTGQSGAVVRYARDDDPAPIGSVIYAFPYPEGCVIGFVSAEDAQSHVVGRLPSGGCLSP